MNAPTLAFRFRVFIILLLHLLGFLPPWVDTRNHGTLWLTASAALTRTGAIGLATATLAVTLIALACLALGSGLRVCGTAYLSSAVVRGATMQCESFVVAGPYRHLRNPLYAGSWLVALSVSILMPPSGAALFLPALSLFLVFLISQEERFLSARLGDSYRQYRNQVPRLFPRLLPRAPGALSAPSAARPTWFQAVLTETFPIAFTLCFSFFAWRYNARILVRCLLICYGLSLLIRALTKAAPPAAKI
jgi:protein-S-isoprenylcysteine O-methyltransferase Ste14